MGTSICVTRTALTGSWSKGVIAMSVHRKGNHGSVMVRDVSGGSCSHHLNGSTETD